MPTQQLQDWLILNRAPGIGPITINKLLKAFGSPHSILKDNIRSLNKFKLSEETLLALKNPDWNAIERTCRWAEQAEQHILTLDNPKYPQLLRETASPPPVLYIKGKLDTLEQHKIAIVGSRNPTPLGHETAGSFAYRLSSLGLCVTSGLALGIDAAGHRGALKAEGTTIAVLGSGVESIYPKRHKALADEIICNGCLVSEFPLNASPRPQHFPQRNRIISGLSLGTLVVEAKPRSGSLITAKFANEQGRDVFAIPGSIHNPLARGCHQLIRDGAKLVETVNDILEELGITSNIIDETTSNQKRLHNFEGLERQHIKLLECVDFEVTSINQIIMRSQLSASEVTAMLLIPELHGYICAVPGGYRRIK